MLKYIFTYHPVKRLAVAAIIAGGPLAAFCIWTGSPGGVVVLMLASAVGVTIGTCIAVAYCERFSYSICCESCRWIGGLSDVQYHKGLCPICRRDRFMYPDKTSCGWKRPFSIEVVSMNSDHRFYIQKNRTLSQLEDEKDRIWVTPPHRWWQSKIPSSGERIQEAVGAVTV
jgi:hypothetical protein